MVPLEFLSLNHCLGDFLRKEKSSFKNYPYRGVQTKTKGNHAEQVSKENGNE